MEIRFFYLFWLGYLINTILHTIFAIKYWVVSKKIKCIMGQEDRNIETKAYVLIIYQIISFISTNIVYFKADWK